MSVKPTIMILLLAVIAGSAMVWDLRAGPSRAQAASHGGRLHALAALPIDDITRITLVRRDEAPMMFERRGIDWHQTQPFAYPMDPFSIRQFAVIAHDLDVFDQLTIDELRGGQTLQSLGLDQPAAAVTFEWPGDSLSIELGRRSVAGRAFARISKGSDSKGTSGRGAIYVVNHKLHDRAVDMDPKEWRSRTLFQNVGVESDRIEYQAGTMRMALERERKQWKMVEPAQTRLDPVGRDAYFSDLARVAASGFIYDQPEDLARFGLNPPEATLTIVNPGAQSAAPSLQKLLIGRRIGGNTRDRFAMIEHRPVIVRLSEPALIAVLRQPRDLADPTACGVQPADVKSIVIRPSGNGEEFKFERDLERWRAPEADNKEVNAAQVQELLDQLTQVRAPAVEFAEFPRDMLIATITFHGHDGRALDTIRIARHPETRQWAMDNGENVLRVFPANTELRLKPAEFGLTP